MVVNLKDLLKNRYPRPPNPCALLCLDYTVLNPNMLNLNRSKLIRGEAWTDFQKVRGGKMYRPDYDPRYRFRLSRILQLNIPNVFFFPCQDLVPLFGNLKHKLITEDRYKSEASMFQSQLYLTVLFVEVHIRTWCTEDKRPILVQGGEDDNRIMAVVYATYVMGCKENRSQPIDRTNVNAWFEEHIAELPDFKKTEDFAFAYYDIMVHCINQLIESREDWIKTPKPIEEHKFDELLKDEDGDEDANMDLFNDSQDASQYHRSLTNLTSMNATLINPTQGILPSVDKEKEADAFKTLLEMGQPMPLETSEPPLVSQSAPIHFERPGPPKRMPSLQKPDVPVVEFKVVQPLKVSAPMPGEPVSEEQKPPQTFARLPPIAPPMPLPDGDLAFHNAIARAMNEHRLWLTRTNNRGTAPSYPATLLSEDLLRQAGFFPSLERKKVAEKRRASPTLEEANKRQRMDDDPMEEDVPLPDDESDREKIEKIKQWMEEYPQVKAYIAQSKIGVSKQWTELAHNNAALLRKVEDLQSEMVKLRQERDLARSERQELAAMLERGKEDQRKTVELFKKWNTANPPPPVEAERPGNGLSGLLAIAQAESAQSPPGTE